MTRGRDYTRELWLCVGVERGAALAFWAEMAARNVLERSTEARSDVCVMMGLARECADAGVSWFSIHALLNAGAALGEKRYAMIYGYGRIEAALIGGAS